MTELSRIEPKSFNFTLSLCRESNPNQTPVIVLCAGGFLRNQNSRQSLHANTFWKGKAAKVKNRGQRVRRRASKFKGACYRAAQRKYCLTRNTAR